MTEKEFSIVVAQFTGQTHLRQSELENFIMTLLQQCKVTLKEVTGEGLVKIVSAAVSCLSISKDVAAGDYIFSAEELRLIQSIINGGKCNASVH